MDYTFTSTANSQADYKVRRSKDEKDEKIVGDFLDNFFYPTFATTITRCTEKDLQVRGLDVTLSNTDWTITIDEKAATRWAGRNLQTFAHEVSAINRLGKEYEGWLLDFNSCSDYLLEVWLDELSSTDNLLHSTKDIKDATICLIKKQDLWSYLKKNNVNSQELKRLGDNLRLNNLYSTYYNGFKVMCLQGIQEKTVNILISRNTLINTISTYAVRYKDGEITTLRKR